MKKTFFLSIITASMIFVSSCNKDLNQAPISLGTTDNFYQSASDFIQGINGVYNDLRNYPDRLLFLSEIRSDNIYGVSSLGVRDWDPINNFQRAIAGNTYVEEAWAANFNGILRANTLLGKITTNGANIGSASLATRLQGEARYLRAFYYFDLVKYFGKVPVIDHPVLSDEANTIGRSPVADVYKFIIADLQFAIANLPGSYTGVDVGRVTKYAAEATLAQVYMARSGVTYGIDGPGLGLNEWGLALPLINDIITNGGFVFNPSYASIFSYTNQSPTTNKEAVFDVMYQTGLSGTAAVYGADFVWQLAPNQWFKAVKNDSKSNGSLEIIPTSNDLTNSYATADVRKAFNINLTPYTDVSGTEARPFFKKYIDLTKLPSSSRFDWGINFIAIRYTDILMMKAECILRGATGGGTQTDVDAIVNQIRTRANAAAVPLLNVTLAQLFDERRKEFADEGSRWFDLQRSGNLIAIMNAWITAEDGTAKKQMNQVIPGYVIYPVPQSQLDAAPGLYTQNTGY
ncbi:MAG: RagB/SusD family nutrient uptake outer membrane protein [Mucilaginibacter sp.]|uniref:RagB/SusD family nutrient uptake outer membrane protein n=1 Tax=Mucilaginibacter sp. TaxID=1882438 RepID=UPI00326697B7